MASIFGVNKDMLYGNLPTESLRAWALLNNVELQAVQVVQDILDKDGSSKGGGLVADRNVSAGDVLLKVPGELIVSRDQVEQCAKVDLTLRDVLTAVEVFAKTPRLAILVFLVYQMTMGSPGNRKAAGTKQSPHADYVKFLPKEIPLPIFYREEECELLSGTSLASALQQKLASLEKEFDQLREATSSVMWCQSVWWDEESGILTFDDWKLADALYRSRALELPRGVGDSMVPVVDMANHASDNRSNARFEVDEDGNVLLVVRDDKSIAADEEVTIMYGVGGATEMIFSYGFLEEGAGSAREMFLGLSIPGDDPLRAAKIRYAEEAPGVRIFVDDTGKVQWDSSYVWWACVNEEDGLGFHVAVMNDGGKELKASWKGHEFEAHELKDLLMADELRDIFVLRATVLIQQRLEEQGMQLAGTDEAFLEARDRTSVESSVWKLVNRLRNLELELITQAFEQLEIEKGTLMDSVAVRNFLGTETQRPV